MGSIIFSHNKQILQPCNENYECNCGKKESCPLDNKSLMPNIIYKAQVTNNTSDEHTKYLGAVETSFKERYRNNAQDFKHEKYMRGTELSKYIWSLKSQVITPIVKWRIVKKVNSGFTELLQQVMLNRKFFIIKSLDDCNWLNRRSEIVSKCNHQNKLLLCNVRRNDSMD